MDLHTYTRIWELKRVIYRVEDVKLPTPISAERFLLYAACFLTWCGSWGFTIGVTVFLNLFTGPTGKAIGTALAGAWYFLPPYLTVRVLSKRREDGESLWQMLTAQAAYMVRPPAYMGGVSQRHTRWWLRWEENTSRFRQVTRPQRPVTKPKVKKTVHWPRKPLKRVLRGATTFAAWVVEDLRAPKQGLVARTRIVSNGNNSPGAPVPGPPRKPAGDRGHPQVPRTGLSAAGPPPAKEQLIARLKHEDPTLAWQVAHGQVTVDEAMWRKGWYLTSKPATRNHRKPRRLESIFIRHRGF